MASGVAKHFGPHSGFCIRAVHIYERSGIWTEKRIREAKGSFL